MGADAKERTPVYVCRCEEVTEDEVERDGPRGDDVGRRDQEGDARRDGALPVEDVFHQHRAHHPRGDGSSDGPNRSDDDTRSREAGEDIGLSCSAPAKTGAFEFYHREKTTVYRK